MTVEVEVTNAPESTSGGAGRVEQASVDAFKEFEKSQGALEAIADLTGVDHADRPAAEPAAEAKPTAEAEEGAEEAAAEAAGEEKPTAEAKPAAEAKGGKKSAKERIGEITRQREEARRESSERAAEVERLRAENEALKAGKAPPAAAADPDAEPDPEKFEYGTLDPAYQAAVRKYDRDQIRKEMAADRQAEAAQSKDAELGAKFDAQVEALDAEVGDYVEKVVVGAQEKRWALSAELGALVKQSDVGAKIAYHLASNPEESIALYRKSPLEQAAWFGRKEAELTAPTGKPSGKQPALSKADPPADNVRGQGGKFAPNAATTDFSKFEQDFSHLLNQ